MPEEVISDVACTVCACVCDDIEVTVRDGQIVKADRACQLTETWFSGSWTPRGPTVRVHGTETPFQQAIDESARILKAARSPLIFGLSRSSTDGQRAAVALADRLGAIVDTTASEGHAPSILAMQECGESTCTLGEIRNRADLVIYWGADPVITHPRHMERYSIEPTGLMIPKGREDRTLVVVDHAPSATSAQADKYIKVKPDRDFDALWVLRGLLKGIEPKPDDDLGASIDGLKELAERMKTCRCGVIFFGYGLVRNPLGHRSVEALLRLVIELNQFTRFHARRLRVVGDVSGADSVLCWQTGYPFSVNLSRGFPRYNPGEYSARDVLENGEADALVLVGSSHINQFPPAAQEHISKIPTIVLDGVNAELPLSPTIQFTTATYGIHRSGTAYRMDEVPIRLRSVLPSNLPTDADVLRAIQVAVDRATP